VPGTPYVELDGDCEIVGGMTYGNKYPAYRAYFDQHKTIPSPLDIRLTCTYDSATNQGQLGIKLKNTMSSGVSGQLQVALCENHICHVWGDLDSLHHVERNMLPDALGEAVTVPANDSITRTRDFLIDAAWVARNCEFVVFVQNNSTRAILQGARIGVYQEPELAYRGHQSAYPEPGQDANLVLGLRNIGSGDAADVTGTLSTRDPYVTVTTADADFSIIAIGQDVYSQTPFAIHVDSACPNNHLATMDLAVAAAGGYTADLSFPLNISTDSVFSDEFEGGENGWTHSGTRDTWHQTENRSLSPTHSWYSAVEDSWLYTNENDARLITPYFTSGDSAQPSFDRWSEVQSDREYCMREVNNGSRFWVMSAIFTGASSDWVRETVSLAEWSGQTIRVAFRFLSDYSGTAEGWHVDNFLCEPYETSVAEPKAVPLRQTVAATNPARGRAEISYAIRAGRTGTLAAYDVNGRLVSEIAGRLTGTVRTMWDLARVEAGAYFVRLSDEASSNVTKIVVAK